MRSVFRSGARRGRETSKPLVAIIDEMAARTLFPNQDPIGKRVCKLALPPEKQKWFQIVGVVRDVVYNRPTAKHTLPTMYFAEAQETAIHVRRGANAKCAGQFHQRCA